MILAPLYLGQGAKKKEKKNGIWGIQRVGRSKWPKPAWIFTFHPAVKKSQLLFPHIIIIN